jgi:hypothetical protein
MVLSGADIDRKLTSDLIDRQLLTCIKEQFQNLLRNCIESWLFATLLRCFDDLSQPFYFFCCFRKFRFYRVFLAFQDGILRFERMVLFFKYRYLLPKKFEMLLK